MPHASSLVFVAMCVAVKHVADPDHGVQPVVVHWP
jgi:hypothetical protein